MVLWIHSALTKPRLHARHALALACQQMATMIGLVRVGCHQIGVVTGAKHAQSLAIPSAIHTAGKLVVSGLCTYLHRAAATVSGGSLAELIFQWMPALVMRFLLTGYDN